jgi:hypothetical protein
VAEAVEDGAYLAYHLADGAAADVEEIGEGVVGADVAAVEDGD